MVKIIKIDGGMGNQMFQYAFACKLKKIYPSQEVLLDISNFEGQLERFYELKNVFDVKIPVATPLQRFRFTLPFSTNTKWGGRIHSHIGKYFKRDIYTEKRPNYFSFSEEPLKMAGSCYYTGVYFNEGYFADIKDEIRSVFTFKQPLVGSFKKIREEIEVTNSVSIHVRRGDYLLYDAYKGICDKEYYDKAIAYIKEHVENPHFFIFSNDIQYCRENLGGLMEQSTFVENNDPQNSWVDMQLMSCCKHNVIAHSSFSWWAAWLNRNPNKIVVAPKRWVNSPDIKDKRPQLADWIQIEQND